MTIAPLDSLNASASLINARAKDTAMPSQDTLIELAHSQASSSSATGSPLTLASPLVPAPPAAPVMPSTIVSLSEIQPQKTADTYAQPLVDVIQVRYQQDKTPAAAKLSNQLISSLSSIRANTSPFSVAALFSQVGNLSRETTEYRNEARSLAMTSDKASAKTAIDFSTGKGKFDQWVNLTVRTKDGDDIAVTVSRFRGSNGDTLEFSFAVTGELSEAEQNALDQLAVKLGEVADDFFRTGSAQLNGLKAFDKANIESFHLAFSKARDDDTAASMSFDYKFDEVAQTQQLTAKDASGYSIDIKANLQGLLVKDSNSAASDSLQQYLRLIDKSLTEHQTNSASRRFIMDGFSSVLTADATIANTKPEQTNTDKIVAAFDSGLADFTATIQAPLRRDSSNYLTPEAMTLQLGQSTKVEQVGERTLIKQTNSYELHTSRIKGRAGGEEGDLNSGNYTYKVMHVKEQTSRLLDMTGDTVNNAYREQENSLDIKEQKFGQFHLQETQTETKQDRALTQLRDTLAAKNLQKDSMEILDFLADDKQSLFIL